MSKNSITNLTQQEVSLLHSYWKQTYDNGGVPGEGMAGMWYKAVTTLQNYRGDEVIPGFIKRLERKVLERGQGEEYFAALIDVVKPAGHLNEATQALYLFAATPEQRAEALRKIGGLGI